jgi:hypothetical protein
MKTTSKSDIDLDPELYALKNQIRNDISRNVQQQQNSQTQIDLSSEDDKVELDVDTVADPRFPDPDWDNKTLRFILFLVIGEFGA